MKSAGVFFTTLTLVLMASVAVTAVPQLINYQGQLTTSAGQPAADGKYLIRFIIYDAAAGGTVLWDNNFRGVQVTGGLFTYLLGDSTTLPGNLFATDTVRYLGITVGSDAEMTPRARLTSAAYGYKALRADTAAFATTIPDNSVTGTKIQDGAIGFIDIGNNGASAGQVIKWNGTSWTAAADEMGSASGWQDDGSVVSLQAPTDSVGIGTAAPVEKLDVEGNIQASGTIKSGNSITIDGTLNRITSSEGRIEFEDDSLQTSGVLLVGSDFDTWNTGLYVNRDINTSDIASGILSRISNSGNAHISGVRAVASSPNLPDYTKFIYGLSGEAYSNKLRIGVLGLAGRSETGSEPAGGRAVGVAGQATSGEFSTAFLGNASAQRIACGGEYFSNADDSAYGVRATAEVLNSDPGTGKHSYGIYGEATGGDTAIGLYATAYNTGSKAWAAFLDGDVTIRGKLGIGLFSPTQPLDVDGNLKTTGFIMPTGAASGRVLTSDASGIASWQAPSGAGVDHGTLSNLSGDHHLQYLRTDGTRALTGNWSAGNFKITNLGSATTTGDAVPYQQAIKSGDAAGGDLSSTYPNPQIAASAVGSPEILDGSVSSTDIANSTIVDADVSASASIAPSKISGTAATLSATQTFTNANTFSDGLYVGDSTLVVSTSGMTAGTRAGGIYLDRLLWLRRGYNTASARNGLYSEITNASTGTLYAVRAKAEATTAGSGGLVYGGMYSAISDGANRFGLHATGGAKDVSITTGYSYGMYGSGTDGSTAFGVYGSAASATTGYGVYGTANDNTTNYAGYFSGDLHCTGTLSKGGGSFRIDHPLDPENKYLQHSFVESPDMMNVYNGNVITDANGTAVVTLPDYFPVLNRDFRYQLTVIGQFAQAIIAEKITDNRFTIRTDKPNVEVSWQVTGIRQDKFAEANRIQVEVEKKPDERGRYLHPQAYGMDEERGIDFENNKVADEMHEADPSVGER